MRILLVSPMHKVGGISRWTQHILSYESLQSDVKVLQYYGDDSRNSKRKLFWGARIFYGIKEYFPLCKKTSQLLKTRQYDIVHLCTSASISLIKDILILQSAHNYGIKSCIHFHFGRIPEIFMSRNWEYKLLIKVLELANCIIVIDKRSYNVLLEAGYKNVKYLPNPLAGEIDTLVLNSNIIRRYNKLVFAGHVIVTKGVVELVRACKSIDNIQLNILGSISEEMRRVLENEAGVDYQSWLNITGEQSYVNTIKEMLSAGVFVLPTYSEGFPNVILESMACGCPIVTTDVGAIPEMLDIEHGFNYGICVKPKDVEGLRVAIEKMLNDREYALQCGRNAQKRVREEYSMPIVWDKLVSIWKSTLEN